MDQETWDILFGWLTGNKCLIPEGCDPPLIGILFYLGIVILVGLITYAGLDNQERTKKVMQIWKK